MFLQISVSSAVVPHAGDLEVIFFLELMVVQEVGEVNQLLSAEPSQL